MKSMRNISCVLVYLVPYLNRMKRIMYAYWEALMQHQVQRNFMEIVSCYMQENSVMFRDILPENIAMFDAWVRCSVRVYWWVVTATPCRMLHQRMSLVQNKFRAVKKFHLLFGAIWLLEYILLMKEQIARVSRWFVVKKKHIVKIFLVVHGIYTFLRLYQGCHCWGFPPRYGFFMVMLGSWVLFLKFTRNLGFKNFGIGTYKMHILITIHSHYVVKFKDVTYSFVFKRLVCSDHTCSIRIMLHNAYRTSETVTDRLLAKQATTRKGATSSSWEPSPELSKEVVDGTCHRRYASRLKSYKNNELITIEGVNEDDEDMYSIDH